MRPRAGHGDLWRLPHLRLCHGRAKAVQDRGHLVDVEQPVGVVVERVKYMTELFPVLLSEQRRHDSTAVRGVANDNRVRVAWVRYPAGTVPAGGVTYREITLIQDAILQGDT